MRSNRNGVCIAEGCDIKIDRQRWAYCREHWKLRRAELRSWHWQLEEVSVVLWGLDERGSRLMRGTRLWGATGGTEPGAS